MNRRHTDVILHCARCGEPRRVNHARVATTEGYCKDCRCLVKRACPACGRVYSLWGLQIHQGRYCTGTP